MDRFGNRICNAAGLLPRAASARWVLAAALCCLGGASIANEFSGSREYPPDLSVSLSPDGQLLALSNDSGLWSMPVEGGVARPLLPAGTVARNPGFSPDGTFLVYQAEHSGQWDLWLLELAGGDSRQITSTDYDEVEPVFWPDGHSVVFASNRSGTYDVWELHLSSGALRRLTGRSGDASFPSVSEHGDVVYANELDGRWSLYLLRTGVTTLLARRTYPLRAPSWRPGGGLVVLNEQPTPTQSNLVMLLLDTRPLFKNLTRGELIAATPASWLSAGELLYAAGSQLWKRPLGSGPRQPVRFVPLAP